MPDKKTFDFWYAVNNTEVVLPPSKHLETFGATVLHYHLISELMDTTSQIRVREGRMRAHRPTIITPEAYSQTMLEGFGDEARKYVDWLRSHEQQVRILQYGFTLRNESFSEQTMTDNVQNVVERVKKDVQERNEPFNAVVLGVDQPWDVCLIKLFWDVIAQSAQPNIAELEKHRLFEDVGGMPRGVRNDIERRFLAASRNPALIKGLARTLQQYHIFEEYQDRFFALVKASGGKAP